jgi:hypothetical protein
MSRLSVFDLVDAVPGFAEQPSVINGCPDLFVEVFGEASQHTRAAVAMGSQVEIGMGREPDVLLSWRLAAPSDHLDPAFQKPQYLLSLFNFLAA